MYIYTVEYLHIIEELYIVIVAEDIQELVILTGRVKTEDENVFLKTW